VVPDVAEYETVASEVQADKPGEGLERRMIGLTRLNGQTLYVNPDLLKYAEASPDTLLTLVTDEKVVVLETCAQVMSLVLEYRARVLNMAWPDAAGALGVLLMRSAWMNASDERMAMAGRVA
jgi:flagellar protein FlbD